MQQQITQVGIRFKTKFLNDFDEFVLNTYSSRNKAIIDLIKTHPDYVKHSNKILKAVKTK